MNALGRQLCCQLLPGLGWQCSGTASSVLSTSAWRHVLRYFSCTAPPCQQQQQQQEVPETGLAFDDVYVDCSSLTTIDTPETREMHQEPPITAVFLHGLLGSSRNWRSFTRKLALEAAAHTDRDVRCLLVDLRCHGASAARHGFHPPHSMAAAAEDVAELIQQQLGGGAPHLLVGLSLGGKVALQLLKHMVEVQESQQQLQQMQQPVHHLYSAAPAIAPPEDGMQQQQDQHSQTLLQGLPQQVWVLDSQPGSVPLDVDAPTSVGKIIELIHSIPTPLENRQVLYKLLAAKGIPPAVAQWLGTSLVPGGRLGNGNGNGSGSDQKLDWAFDVQGCAALYNSYRLSSYWDCLSCPPPGVTMHLVRGELSDRWTPHMLQQLEDAEKAWRATTAGNSAAVGNLQMHVLAKAGHWLQADNPDGLHAMMLPWIRDLHQNRLVH